MTADRTFESEAALGADLRVIASDAATGQGPAEDTAAYVAGLGNLGWKRFDSGAALSPDSEICLTAAPLEEYLADPERPEEVKVVLRHLDRQPDRIGVISAIFC